MFLHNPAIPAINARTDATFKITNITLYVLVVTVLIQNDTKLLELKAGFERTIIRNKYKMEMFNQTKKQLNLNKAGFFESSFFWRIGGGRGGGSQFDPPLIFQEELI